MSGLAELAYRHIVSAPPVCVNALSHNVHLDVGSAVQQHGCLGRPAGGGTFHKASVLAHTRPKDSILCAPPQVLECSPKTFEGTSSLHIWCHVTFPPSSNPDAPHRRALWDGNFSTALQSRYSLRVPRGWSPTDLLLPQSQEQTKRNQMPAMSITSLFQQ